MIELRMVFRPPSSTTSGHFSKMEIDLGKRREILHGKTIAFLCLEGEVKCQGKGECGRQEKRGGENPFHTD